MRGYEQAVEVETDSTFSPTAFIWRGRGYRVEHVLERWRERLPWWRLASPSPGAYEMERVVWRVVAAPGQTPHSGVFEIAQSPSAWTLLRLID